MSEKIRIRWLTNASFEIQACGKVIITDPCLTLTPHKEFDGNSFDQVDAVLISHLHWDHISDLPAIEKKHHPEIFTGVRGADELAAWIDCNTSFIYPMYPDQELDMGEFTVKCLYNRHANVNKTKSEQSGNQTRYTFWDDYPGMIELGSTGGMEMCSYLITFRNGFKILFWGGNIAQNQITHLRGMNPDVALMQYSKQGAVALTELAQSVNPKVLIPHHHDLRKPYEDEAVQAKLEVLRQTYPGKLLTPANGEWMEFEI